MVKTDKIGYRWKNYLYLVRVLRAINTPEIQIPPRFLVKKEQWQDEVRTLVKRLDRILLFRGQWV